MPDDTPSSKPATAKGQNATLFDMNRRAFSSWAHGMSQLSQEMAEFMQVRLQKEAALWEKLATCRDPADFVECQSQFLAKTGTDYAEAAQNLSRLMLDFASGYGMNLVRGPTETH